MTKEEFMAKPDDEKWHALVSQREAVPALRAALERTRERGVLAGLPWWARIALVNFPVLAALFFMGQDAGYIPSLAKAQGQSLARIETSLGTHAAEHLNLVARLTTALVVMCENSARDEVSRTNCRLIGPVR